jgi:hypothetical protein
MLEFKLILISSWNKMDKLLFWELSMKETYTRLDIYLLDLLLVFWDSSW